MILQMDRIQIWGLKAYLERVIPLLHNFGNMQIDDVRQIADTMVQPFTMPDAMQAEREAVDLLIANINGLKDLFSSLIETNVEAMVEKEDTIPFIQSKVTEITTQVQYLNNQKKFIQDELVSLSKYNDMLSVIAPLLPNSAKKSGNASIRALVHSSQMRTMNILAQQLKLLTRGKFDMVSIKVGESTNAIVGIFPLEMIDQVETFLKNEKVTQLILPEEYAYLSTDEALQHITKKVQINHLELDEIDERLQKIAAQWLSKLHIWQLVCQDRVDEFEAYAKIGETEYTFTIFGWVPQERIDDLRKLLSQNFAQNVILSIIDVPSVLKDKIPVATKNPGVVQPYEDFVKMRAIPKYSDIDPSHLVAIFMPIFFGMMVGDVGYGVLMLVIALLLGKKMAAGLIRNFFKALQAGAIWSIFFGILYGEYFGTLGEKWGIPALWFNRSDANSFTTLLGMSLAVGVVHILLGLVIGVWNAFVQKNRSHLLERGGMFIGIIGICVLIASLTKTLPHGFSTLGWVILAVGVSTLALSLGKTGIIMGPIEFVGVIGNVLSYLRIAALGLASVFLAKVANDLGGMVGSVVVGVLIALLIHALNLVMGMLSPTIQSLRLQYVEFFRKFYEGGQSPFTPFRKRIENFGVHKIKA